MHYRVTGAQDDHSSLTGIQSGLDIFSLLKDKKGRWELTPKSAVCQVLCTCYL